MSPKKQRSNHVTAKPSPQNSAPAKETAPVAKPAAAAPEAAPVSAPADGTPLLAEVQSFIQRREELARKLSDEITSTEERLAELKRTAAALFPENNRPAPVANKDKKVKKLPKAKPLPAKTEGAASEETSAAAEPAATDGAAS
ncbi:hypothetical protein [Anatilimnocola floriformis]|uniref:hypothetical protein n=1 Tax=Anatilimnocola floriformis TaxID=2948575 RepID=UPI0020C4A390|nr:hypothetical protein [Anatilimnocola floriformis]